MKYSYLFQCCRNAVFCVSFLTQAQFLIINQTDYGYKLFPPPRGSIKNNANGWEDLSLGDTRLCSCGMQMHEA